MEEFFFEVGNGEQNLRIDKYLAQKLPDQSRSYIQKLIKDEQVTVHNQKIKSNYKVQSGDQLRVELPKLQEPDILPEDIPLDILYEDEDVLVINKPKGMVVHPSAGHYSTVKDSFPVLTAYSVRESYIESIWIQQAQSLFAKMIRRIRFWQNS